MKCVSEMIVSKHGLFRWLKNSHKNTERQFDWWGKKGFQIHRQTFLYWNQSSGVFLELNEKIKEILSKDWLKKIVKATQLYMKSYCRILQTILTDNNYLLSLKWNKFAKENNSLWQNIRKVSYSLYNIKS